MEISRNSQIWKYASSYNYDLVYKANAGVLTLCNVVSTMLFWVALQFVVGLMVGFVLHSMIFAIYALAISPDKTAAFIELGHIPQSDGTFLSVSAFIGGFSLFMSTCFVGAYITTTKIVPWIFRQLWKLGKAVGRLLARRKKVEKEKQPSQSVLLTYLKTRIIDRTCVKVTLKP